MGEFEQLVVLAILCLGSEAYGASIARALESGARRSVSRGALYTTLDRLEEKGYVRWKLGKGGPERAHLPTRVYSVTAAGLTAIRSAQDVYRRMSRGLEHILKVPQV